MLVDYAIGNWLVLVLVEHWYVSISCSTSLRYFRTVTVDSIGTRGLTEIGDDDCKICGIPSINVQVAMSSGRVGRPTFEHLTRTNLPYPGVKIWSIGPLQVCQ